MARIFTKLSRGPATSTSGNRVFKPLRTSLEQLPPPYDVYTSGPILFWGDYSALATSFDILVDGVVKATTNEQSFDLGTLNLAYGTYSITVVSKADGYANSDPSEAVSFYEPGDGGSYD